MHRIILRLPFWMCALGLVISCCENISAQEKQAPHALPVTQPLTTSSDISSDLVDGVDRFLLNQLQKSVLERQQQWPRSQQGISYEQATLALRDRLQQCLGLKDTRIDNHRFVFDSPRPSQAWIAKGSKSYVHHVRWTTLEGVESEGLLVLPIENDVRFQVILVPDAGQTPEEVIQQSKVVDDIAGQSGCILVPSVISRHREARRGRAQLTDQEYLYRSAFELGRHIIGYQVQELQTAIDILDRQYPNVPTVVAGWGEGGMLAQYAAAVDPRIDAVLVSGHFGPREKIWDEPIHRNVQGLLTSFGDAQLAAMIAPRSMIIDAIPGPTIEVPGQGGAPGKLNGPSLAEAEGEWTIAKNLLDAWNLSATIQLVRPQAGDMLEQPSRDAWLKAFQSIQQNVQLPNQTRPFENWLLDDLYTREARRIRTLQKWDRFNQRLLETIDSQREQYWKRLDTTSPGAFATTVEPYRTTFRNEIIGAWSDSLLPANPRSRLVYEKEKWLGYEVVLDVFPDVIAFGILLIPRDVQKDEKRPVVVFQHGLEGRPKDVIEGDHKAYHDVAARLADQGYIVFAPQNLYLFQDRFRTLQRKSNPLGKTLFSTIVAQHQQLVNWLSTLPQVDAKRIAFYGLSYGGKSAMRIPALIPEYCLSICSADFNDWVWKNASTHSTYSYVWTGEYEIFEFDLGPKFNYAEMATLIAPRPFMVERGHFDGVAPDERVGLEFAKVQHMYAARLGLPDRAQIEWFVGPHTVHGQGTFRFLAEHLGRQDLLK